MVTDMPDDSREEGSCPICGDRSGSRKLVAGGGNQHRCPEKALRGIDAAHARADMGRLHEWPSEPRRLYDGLLWLIQDELEDVDEMDGGERPNF
jgi:hypothetical protein